MSPQPYGGSRVSLRRVLDQVELVGAEDVLFCHCEIDPAKVRPGDLFVALASSGADPYLGAYHAAANGAGAVLADTFLPELGVPVAIVPDTGEACAQLAHALAGFPSRVLPVVGLVGGRCARLGAAFLQTVLAPVDPHRGVAAPEAAFASPEAMQFLWGTDPRLPAWWLRAMADSGVRISVLPIPEKAVSAGKLAGFHFFGLALGPVRRGFRRRLGRQSVGRWLRLVDQIDPAGWAVVARDNPFFECMLQVLEVPGVTVDVEGPAEVSAQVVEESLRGQLVLLRVDDEVHVVRLRLPGREALYGALLATALALGCGIDLLEIPKRLSHLSAVPGYLQPLDVGGAWSALVDEFSSFDDLEQTLATVRRLSRGAVHCVLPSLRALEAGGDLDCSIGVRLRLIKLLRWADALYLRTDWKDVWDVLGGAAAFRGHSGTEIGRLRERIVVCEGVEAALTEAVRACRPGDTVLVSLPVGDDQIAPGPNGARQIGDFLSRLNGSRLSQAA
ncbi:MAG: hypothetical protein NZ899_04425 [Thermoguttaceae bacterium]|nr:hypothetical protein [Thermoguttaceae bacterium]MDW8077831.1 hypothetical protein [Thermoguttaceae bacterium]